MTHNRIPRILALLLVVQDSMDEAVVAALHDKGRIQESLLDALKARIRKAKGGGH